MPYDEHGNYTETCTACEVGGNMRDGMEEKCKPVDNDTVSESVRYQMGDVLKGRRLPDNDKPVAAVSSNVDHVSEIVELRALVARMKYRLKTLTYDVVGMKAHETITEGLADNGSLKYEIH